MGLDVEIVKAVILHTTNGLEHKVVALLIVQVKELDKEVAEENMQIVILLVLIVILTVVGVQVVHLLLIVWLVFQVIILLMIQISVKLNLLMEQKDQNMSVTAEDVLKVAQRNIILLLVRQAQRIASTHLGQEA